MQPYSASGLAQIYAGADAAALIGVPAGDARVPDVIGVTRPGVVYAAKPNKIAEHGGANPADRNVPIVVAGAGVHQSAVVDEPVQTTQVAPTVLHLLGLDPTELQAVRAEHTAALPGTG